MKSYRELAKDKPYLFFLSSAIFLIVLTSVLIGTILWEAYPGLSRNGITDFIFGTSFGGPDGRYGIWHFIMGTFWMTAVTMCMAVPLGLFTAIYLAEFAHPKVRSILKSSIELLVGIPSVVYGIFGLFILKDPLRDHFNPLVSNTLGTIIPIFRVPANSDGTGVFLASVILTVMVVPTIISIAEDSLRSVKREYREGSTALGATQWETIQKVVIPTALSGIMAGVTLGLTRAVGETMAIVMLLGNVTKTPTSIFDTGYAITSKILNDIPSAYGSYPEVASALFGMAAILFVIDSIFIAAARFICRNSSRD
jgi:phosphate transport system permease protein